MNEMKNVKHICTGLLAHVDAGKTTCVEAMLLNSGTIRRAGRVDHGDTILDYDEQERSHGITIYAKEAHMKWMDAEIDLIDTPGHVDFSAEMERSLSVLDLARQHILVFTVDDNDVIWFSKGGNV